ncbi:hypothetical protein MMC08_005059, partial [Hypocenomyce scalaris]|nr:hypothetical protein [Hypocenomyce scalaris]
MSRSAADATRFTATSPHAYSKPTASRSAPSNTSSPSSAPRTQPTRSGPLAGRKGSPRIGSIPLDGSETPQEKVARLRAAHEAAKQAQISSWDTVVVRGRVWADRAHRFAAVGLISLT